MTCGAVNALATMAAAVALRTPADRHPALPRRRLRRRRAARAAGGDVAAATALSTSSRVITPSGAGAGDRAQVDAQVLGQLAHRRLGQRHQLAGPGAGASRRRRHRTGAGAGAAGAAVRPAVGGTAAGAAAGGGPAAARRRVTDPGRGP